MDRATMNALASDITAIIEQFLAQEQDTQVHTLTITYAPATSEYELEVEQTVTITRLGKQAPEEEFIKGVPIVFPEDVSERQADDARLTAFNAQLQEVTDDLVTDQEQGEYEQAVRRYAREELAREGFPPLTTTARDLLRETANALIENKDKSER
jgi:hypothetical protein